jgi:CDP-diglyceride synthetase
MMVVWSRRLWLDLVLAVAGAAAIARISNAPSIDPGSLYQVAGGAAIGITAFVVTPVATLLSLASGPRFKAFDRAQRPRIIVAMCWAFGLSLSLLVVSGIGSAVDSREDAASLIRWTVVALLLASSLAAVRLFWFFVAGLKVNHTDEDRPIRPVAETEPDADRYSI